MPHVVFEKDLDLDDKKRATLTGAEYDRYHMTRMDDGTIILEPRVLVHPSELSEAALARLDRAADNFKKGKVSAPVNPEDLLRSR